MANEHAHQLEHYRALAVEARDLCRALSADADRNQQQLATIFTALREFPEEVYDDRELLGVLDALVDDGFAPASTPYLVEPWGGLLLKLGFLHIRHYLSFGRPQSLERALFLSGSAGRLVSREEHPRLWALLQFLTGNSTWLLLRMRGESALEALKHHERALELIRREEDPFTWVDIMTQRGHIFLDTPTGDRRADLRMAADIFSRVQATREHIGDAGGAAEAQTTLARVLEALDSLRRQEMKRSLESDRIDQVEVEPSGGVEIEEEVAAHETVNFTAYYPRTGAAGRKYGFVVYAHLPELRDDVNADAQKFSAELGGQMPPPRRSRSDVKLERGTLVTVVPECDEVEFDPPALTKKWDGGWERFLFDFEPDRRLVGEVVLVHISVQVAGIEIASIGNCAIEVTAPPQREEDEDQNPLAHAKSGNQTSALYQKIFVSYSRRDSGITERYKLAQTALGNEAFVDVDNLRAGEDWQAGLARAIDAADVFQLFWSSNSAGSEYCRYEWNYALKFRCPDNKCVGFVRPVYWRKPMPAPPPELSHVNFKYVPLDANAKPNETP